MQEIKTLLYLIEPGIRHRLDGSISDCKNVEVLPRAIAQNYRINSTHFHKIQTRGWLREHLHMVKTRTTRKWELNTGDNFVNLGIEDFFVG